MRFAVVSDIHANLQAWNAVLLDIRSQNLDRIVCLGDLVGYGPNPAEVLRSVHANVNHIVLGNHDAVICGKMDEALFNESARQIIDWTRSQLNRNARRFLASLPLSVEAGAFRCVHGDFSDPAAFNYILDPGDAMASWLAVEHQMLFVGHSHVPGIFLLGPSGTPHRVPPQDFEIEEGKRYIVNVGSVGQPRDGEARASYCIFDSDTGDVWWRRIPFDLDQYREALLATGIPEQASYFLRHDPRSGTPPIRELLNFSPAKTPEQAAHDVVEVQQLVDLQRSVSRWRWIAAVGLACGLLLAAAVAWFWHRHANRYLEIEGTPAGELAAADAPADRNLLPLPEAATRPGEAIPGWTVRLGDRRSQAAVVYMDATKPVLALSSEAAKDAVSLCGPWIAAKPGMKLGYEAMFRKSEVFRGSLVAGVYFRKKAEGGAEESDLVNVKEPNMPRADGWMLAKCTFDAPAGTTAVRFAIRGQFAGRAEISDLRLCRKESGE